MNDVSSWIDRVKTATAANGDFNQASRWLDQTMLVCFGARKLWFKIYRGRIIDAMEYNPATNMLGYDVIVSGAEADWARVIAGVAMFARGAATGLFTVDGDRTEAEKSYKALMVLGSQILPAVGLPPICEDAR